MSEISFEKYPCVFYPLSASFADSSLRERDFYASISEGGEVPQAMEGVFILNIDFRVVKLFGFCKK